MGVVGGAVDDELEVGGAARGVEGDCGGFVHVGVVGHVVVFAVGAAVDFHVAEEGLWVDSDLGGRGGAPGVVGIEDAEFFDEGSGVELFLRDLFGSEVVAAGGGDGCNDECHYISEFAILLHVK